jgi:maleylacetoacetate isomerase
VQQLTLYHYWRSSSSWRVRWALALKGLKPSFVSVDLLSGESEREPHLSRNPLGYVPVLNVDGRYLIESVAILEWLEENIPSPQLYPGDSWKRAHIRALVEVINSDTQPMQNPTVLDNYSQDVAQRKAWAQHFIRRGFSAFQILAAPSAGRHAVGDSVTAADLYLVPQCYNALRFDLDLAEFPLIKRLYEEGLVTPECQAAHPDRFKP